jgi:hypothetical protein
MAAKKKSTSEPSEKPSCFRELKVQVTQADIDQGEPGKPKCCPVYHALKRTAPVGDWFVESISVTDERNSQIYDLPFKVFMAIMKYDRGEGMSPMEFKLMRFSW